MMCGSLEGMGNLKISRTDDVSTMTDRLVFQFPYDQHLRSFDFRGIQQSGTKADQTVGGIGAIVGHFQSGRFNWEWII